MIREEVCFRLNVGWVLFFECLVCLWASGFGLIGLEKVEFGVFFVCEST